MGLVKDRVFVIRSIDYGEADRILTVFGRNFGKYGIIAKGVRKLESKNRGNLQTASISSITFYQGQNLGILREAELEVSPINHEDHFLELKKLLYFLSKLLPDNETDEFIFKSVETLMSKELNLKNLNYFRMKILQELGFVGSFTECAQCGSSQNLNFVQPDELIMVCDNCYNDSSIRSQFVRKEDVRFETLRMTELLDRYVTKIIEQ